MPLTLDKASQHVGFAAVLLDELQVVPHLFACLARKLARVHSVLLRVGAVHVGRDEAVETLIEPPRHTLKQLTKDAIVKLMHLSQCNTSFSVGVLVNDVIATRNPWTAFSDVKPSIQPFQAVLGR
uniref:Uncharacterized protein n=1 Tax=uncultured marine virus TaxID=186617 RepID=A0A0F7L4E8_9VIRU|nr:hypothetical protein [uncultured marine virus]